MPKSKFSIRSCIRDDLTLSTLAKRLYCCWQQMASLRNVYMRYKIEVYNSTTLFLNVHIFINICSICLVITLVLPPLYSNSLCVSPVVVFDGFPQKCFFYGICFIFHVLHAVVHAHIVRVFGIGVRIKYAVIMMIYFSGQKVSGNRSKISASQSMNLNCVGVPFISPIAQRNV